jgi:hypothetical protein
MTADLLVVETYLEDGKEREALGNANKAILDYPDSAEPVRKLARVQRLVGIGDPNATLTRARDKISEASPFLERFLVAGDLEEAGRHDEAVELLAADVDRTHDSPALRLLVSAYINADRRVGAYV